MKKLVLIDGHSILNRAFYGVPDLTNSEGMHTNAVYGFLNIMFKILEEEKPDYLTVAFDRKEPTFRHKMFSEYKGTRKPMPEELRQQVPVMKEVLQAMGVKIVELPGYEADDILGTLAKRGEKEGMTVSLVSGDRDMLQLASEQIKIRIPKTKQGGTEIEDYNTKEVLERYQVQPDQIIDLKGLMGDTADNIPGVPGIGEKRATDIIVRFGSIEGAKEHIEEVTPPKARENLQAYYEQARLSRELATICTDSPVAYSFEEARLGDLYTPEAFQWVKRLEFKSIAGRFGSEVCHDGSLEESFRRIETQKEAEAFLNAVLQNQEEPAGIQLLQEIRDNNSKYTEEESGQLTLFSGEKREGLLGLAICAGEKKAEQTACMFTGGEITEAYLHRALLRLKESGKPLAVMNLKDQLNRLPLEGDSPVCDLAVAAYLLNPLKETYQCDDIARDYLGREVPSRAELLGKAGLAEARIKEPQALSSFGCYCAYTAKNAYVKVMEELEREGMKELYFTMELPLIFTLYDMEKRGIMVNRTALKEYGDQLVGKIAQLEQAIYELAGEKFNINSPKQLGVILFEKMNLPFAKKTKTGYSTSADILEKLRSEDPIAGLILEYRQLAKLKSTYADGLAVYISPVDERIHGKFNQTITATGRISSTEPNLQNIPIRVELGRKIRKVFIPREGYLFLDADYSQIELRVLAHMSGDEKLIEAYKNESDIHKITASEVFHTPYDQVTDLQRRNAKAVNFGIVYGISSFGLGQDLNISRKEAEAYIHKYFETYPKVKEFLDGLVEEAKKDGYVRTMFGRKRPVPELSSSNFMQRSFGERIAMNSPIQGTAADIIKIAMIRVNKRLKEAGMKSQLILQVHDELLIETHKEEVEQVRRILEEEMVHAASLSVTLEIDINEGADWYDAK